MAEEDIETLSRPGGLVADLRDCRRLTIGKRIMKRWAGECGVLPADALAALLLG